VDAWQASGGAPPLDIVVPQGAVLHGRRQG